MGRKNLKVAVGLSGGVDSAVSAYLLKKQAHRLGGQGYDVTGVHIVCWDEGPHCRAREDRADALKVALHLGIPFQVLDFQKEYKERVIDRFYADYEKGLTPNPDIWCNSEIKFGMFLKWALKNKFDYVATGHYAKIDSHTLSNDSHTWSLMVPKDEKKDQTYFLYRLGQEELGRVLFPLGDYLKKDVRGLAEKAGLPVALKPDSQGICFIGEVDVREFLRRQLKEKPGKVVIRKVKGQRSKVKGVESATHLDYEYEVIGVHDGVWFYTIGQRGGWEIDAGYQKKFGGEAPIFYVIEKKVKENQLVVGFGAETYKEKFVVNDLSWISDKLNYLQGGTLQVRVRHGGALIKAQFSMINDQTASIELDEPQRGIAPGQAAVFYREQRLENGDKREIECLGGGVIQ